MSFILVLGTREDPHVERVLDRLSQDPRCDTAVADFLKKSEFAVTVNTAGQVTFEVEGKVVPSNALVWSRTKILPGTPLYPAGDEEHAGYVAQEWRALHNLFARFFEGSVVNSLFSRRGMLKPFQQVIAAKSGFLVPETLVCNVQSRLEAFARRSQGVVLKSLSGGKTSTKGEGEYIPHNVMTVPVDPDEFGSANSDEFSSCPHFVQREIKKSYELRVVVAGSFMQAFKINSQDFKSSEFDWRRGLGLIKFEPMELDAGLTASLRCFMDAMGFVFGSVDLIVDQEGATWFLECNEDGAWAWLDDVVNGKLADAFANELLARAEQRALATEGA